MEKHSLGYFKSCDDNANFGIPGQLLRDVILPVTRTNTEMWQALIREFGDTEDPPQRSHSSNKEQSPLLENITPAAEITARPMAVARRLLRLQHLAGSRPFPGTRSSPSQRAKSATRVCGRRGGLSANSSIIPAYRHSFLSERIAVMLHVPCTHARFIASGIDDGCSRPRYRV